MKPLTLASLLFALLACSESKTTGPEEESSDSKLSSEASISSSKNTSSSSLPESSSSSLSISSSIPEPSSSSLSISSSIPESSSSPISSSSSTPESSSSSATISSSVIVSSSSVIPSLNSQICDYNSRANTLTCAEKTYATTTIGTQVWMAENLNFDAGSGSYCYDDSESKCDTYGRLYKWIPAMDIDEKYNRASWPGSEENHKGICPTGWRLPSDKDWDTLVNYVVANTEATSSSEVGKYLKATSNWAYNSKEDGGDSLGFSALPSGNRGGLGYANLGYYVTYWSSNQFSRVRAYYRKISWTNDALIRVDWSKSMAFSVRCLKD